MSEILNYFRITGPCDLETPICVLQSIADAHSVDFNSCGDLNKVYCRQDLLFQLHSNSVHEVSFNLKSKSLKHIPSFLDLQKTQNFVNPNSSLLSGMTFSYKQLFTALKFIFAFENPLFFEKILGQNKFGKLDSNIIIGWSTPSNPRTLSAPILYGICKYYSIPMRINMSIFDLSNLVDKYFSFDEETLKYEIIRSLEFKSPKDPKGPPQKIDNETFGQTSKDVKLGSMDQTLQVRDDMNMKHNSKNLMKEIGKSLVTTSKMNTRTNSTKETKKKDNEEKNLRNRSKLFSAYLILNETNDKEFVSSTFNFELKSSQILPKKSTQNFFESFSDSRFISSSIEIQDGKRIVILSSISNNLGSKLFKDFEESADKIHNLIKSSHNFFFKKGDRSSFFNLWTNNENTFNSEKIRSGTETIFHLNTFSDSIAYAAILHHIDLSMCSNPIFELSNFLLDKDFLDPILNQRKNSKFTDLDSLDLEIFFNCYLPIKFYSSYGLKNLVRKEGYSNLHFSIYENYELLQSLKLFKSFFHGKHESIFFDKKTNLRRTVIGLDELKDLEDHSVVWYGIQGSYDILIFTYSELLKTFESTRTFLNPGDINNSFFSEIEISKLLILTNASKYPGESHESFRIRCSLAQKIISLRSYLSEENSKVRKFIDSYRNSSPNQQKEIQNMLWNFHELAMYMRGWKGPSSLTYPISYAPVIEEKPGDLDIRVNQASHKFRISCSKLESIGELFLSLPLVRYQNSMFVASNDFLNGITIKDRLEIMASGYLTENEYSCIRMTSNWFASTIYRYMKYLVIDPKFDIEKLEHIL